MLDGLLSECITQTCCYRHADETRVSMDENMDDVVEVGQVELSEYRMSHVDVSELPDLESSALCRVVVRRLKPRLLQHHGKEGTDIVSAVP
jgi:hypothetical protein